jgi:hypothetical protein
LPAGNEGGSGRESAAALAPKPLPREAGRAEAALVARRTCTSSKMLRMIFCSVREEAGGSKGTANQGLYPHIIRLRVTALVQAQLADEACENLTGLRFCQLSNEHLPYGRLQIGALHVDLIAPAVPASASRKRAACGRGATHSLARPKSAILTCRSTLMRVKEALRGSGGWTEAPAGSAAGARRTCPSSEGRSTYSESRLKPAGQLRHMWR